jgi:hypothetical protein
MLRQMDQSWVEMGAAGRARHNTNHVQAHDADSDRRAPGWVELMRASLFMGVAGQMRSDREGHRNITWPRPRGGRAGTGSAPDLARSGGRITKAR